MKNLRVAGILHMPGDKSMSHRAIILSTLAKGTSSIENFLIAEDTMHILEVAKKLGVNAEKKNGILNLTSLGRFALALPDQTSLYFGNSGTASRLMIGVLSGIDKVNVIITGDESLNKRPMKRILHWLRKMGVQFDNADYLPIKIIGGGITVPIDFTETIGSAQIKSAIIFAGVAAGVQTKIKQIKPSRDHTEKMLQFNGVNVWFNGHTFTIPANSNIKPKHYKLWGDISSAAFFVVLALLAKKGGLIIRNVMFNPFRDQFIDVLIRMGGDILKVPQPKRCGEAGGDLIIRPSKLRGVDISESEIPSLIDEIPILCIAAVFAEGRFELRGAKELRLKESDRIATIVKNLRILGVSVEEFEDGLAIEGLGNEEIASHQISGKIHSHMDHRIAMSFEIASAVSGGKLFVEGKEWVKTSFPSFYKLLFKSINPTQIPVQLITLDGPAGSGKSSLAKELAISRNFCQVDSGALYRTITWYWLKKGSPQINKQFIEKLVENPPQIQFYNGQQQVAFLGQIITEEIRTQEISLSIKKIADNLQIRNVVNEIIRKAAVGRRIIADGRDMGSVVFPDAPLKFFITASLEERSRRRFAEFREKNSKITFEEVKKAIAHRDYEDSNRSVGALRLEEGTILIDTTNLFQESALYLLQSYVDFFTL